MQEANIQFVQTSPDDLAAEISKQLSAQISEIKNSIPAPETLMTRDQTAAMLGINLSTLHAWTKNKKLPANYLGGRVYYKRSEIIESLKPSR